MPSSWSPWKVDTVIMFHVLAEADVENKVNLIKGWEVHWIGMPCGFQRV